MADGDACLAAFFVVALGAVVAVLWTMHANLARRVQELGDLVGALGRRLDDAERGAARASAPSPPPPQAPAAAPFATPAPPVPPAPAEPPPIPSPFVRTAPPFAGDARPEPPSPPPPPPRLAPPAPGAAGALETFLGGRVLLVLGVVAVLFALGFFLKLAIEKGWVGPLRRVITGGLTGVAALVAGARLRRRGYEVYGQAVMGLGIGALFLSDYFASVRYAFYERPAAFAIAGAVSALGATLAVRTDARFLAWLGWAGAFLAPALLGRDVDALEGLTGWLVAANAGVGVTLLARRWPGLDVLAAVATSVYFVGWRARHFAEGRLGAAAACLAVLVAVQLAVALLPAALARRRMPATAFVAASVTLLAALACGADLFHPEHRVAFGLAACGAAGAVAAAGALQRRRVPDAGADAHGLFAIALATIVAAIPFLASGTGLPPAWSAFGAACVFAGRLRASRPLTVTGLVGVALGFGAAWIRRTSVGAAEPAFGAEFLSALVPCAALLVVWSAFRDAGPGPRDVAVAALCGAAWGVVLLAVHETYRAVDAGHERLAAASAAAAVAAGLAGGIAVAVARRRPGTDVPAWGALVLACCFALWALLSGRPQEFRLLADPAFGAPLLAVGALAAASVAGLRPRAAGLGAAIGLFLLVVSAELVLWGDRGARGDLSRDEHRHRAQVMLSVFWAVSGAALVAAGFRARAPRLRHAGIALLLVTVGKVFLADLATLDTASRVGSFLALGALLVGASFLYQRLRRPDGPDESGAPPPA